MKPYRSFLYLFGFLLAACTSPTPGSGGSATASAYPIGSTPATNSPSVAYPIASPTRPPGSGNVTPFRLDKPIVAGATQISGTGPAGVPIVLVDVTFMGPVLGQTTIGADGKFVFQVAALEKSHRIGVTLADLTGTKWKTEDFSDQGYQGDEAVLVPQVAFFYDTALVK